MSEIDSPDGANSPAAVVRACSVVASASKNRGLRPIVPVTTAPAWLSALVIPLTVALSAPGAVTSTTRSPVSRSLSR